MNNTEYKYYKGLCDSVKLAKNKKELKNALYQLYLKLDVALFMREEQKLLQKEENDE